MEQLAKQNNNIEHQAKAVAVSSNCKYRALIFKVLERLQFATLEVIERDQHSVFGDREADLKGQIVIHDATFLETLSSTVVSALQKPILTVNGQALTSHTLFRSWLETKRSLTN